jgi:hypothetical protein
MTDHLHHTSSISHDSRMYVVFKLVLLLTRGQIIGSKEQLSLDISSHSIGSEDHTASECPYHHS